MKIKITLTDEMLGTKCNNADVYRDFIGSKAPDAETAEEEVARLGVDDVAEKGTTVFYVDENGNPCLKAYMIKGFFKEACGSLRRVKTFKSASLKAYKTVIDKLIFVSPDYISVNCSGDVGICERPLRAETMQGPRVSLARSQTIPAGSTMEFEVEILDPGLADYIKEWLDYGKFSGLGCWRNSGKGRFTYEVLDE